MVKKQPKSPAQSVSPAPSKWYKRATVQVALVAAAGAIAVAVIQLSNGDGSSSGLAQRPAIAAAVNSDGAIVIQGDNNTFTQAGIVTPAEEMRVRQLIASELLTNLKVAEERMADMSVALTLTVSLMRSIRHGQSKILSSVFPESNTNLGIGVDPSPLALADDGIRKARDAGAFADPSEVRMASEICTVIKRTIATTRPQVIRMTSGTTRRFVRDQYLAQSPVIPKLKAASPAAIASAYSSLKTFEDALDEVGAACLSYISSVEEALDGMSDTRPSLIAPVLSGERTVICRVKPMMDASDNANACLKQVISTLESVLPESRK